MSLEANKQLYRRWLLELWNGNLAITDQIVTPDFIGSWPGRPGLVHGPKELTEIIRMSRDIFLEVTFAVEVGPVAEGDLVAARWIGHGSYKGGHAGRHRARWHPGWLQRPRPAPGRHWTLRRLLGHLRDRAPVGPAAAPPVLTAGMLEAQAAAPPLAACQGSGGHQGWAAPYGRVGNHHRQMAPLSFSPAAPLACHSRRSMPLRIAGLASSLQR
jgi:SnoaL-like polyketide cyclase